MLVFLLRDSLVDYRRIKYRSTHHADVCDFIYHYTSVTYNHKIYTSKGGNFWVKSCDNWARCCIKNPNIVKVFLHGLVVSLNRGRFDRLI